MTTRPTILIMAGGTGGHIFPGLAVANELKSQGWNIHWLGTVDRMEADVVPANDIEISFINIAGVRGKGLISLISAPFKVIHAVWQSMKVIKKVKPAVVLGMGGYASAPGGVAAWLKGIPLVLHEQNAIAGMTNRYLAKIANTVLCAFPNAFANGVKHQVVGNPVRKDIGRSLNNDEQKTEKNILIVGGSLGAKVLNDTVPLALSKIDCPINVWHQTGKGNQQQVVSLYEQCDIKSEDSNVTEFIDDMAQAYEWADLVICRAGALTVSELAMAGKPAIFVPLPHAVDDHQTKNAMFLVEKGGAVLLPQSQLTDKTLAEKLQQIFSLKPTLSVMAKASKEAANPEATSNVANTCKAWVK